MKKHSVDLTVNGREASLLVEPRQSLADALRGELGLTGSHLGCEHGVCGACTVIMDGQIRRSCIALAAACDGASIVTLEGLAGDELTERLKASFVKNHGLQCGFCTPGMIISAREMITRNPAMEESELRQDMSGNLCRCTGFSGIVNAIKEAAEAHRRASQ